MNFNTLAARPVSVDMVEPGEQALVRAARRDPSAFAKLYRQHLRPVYSYILARTGNCQEAEDLTSQTFLAALQGIDHFRGQSKFSTWLLSIARNKCADYFRQRHGQVALDVAETEPASGPQLDDLVEQQARLKELARALNLLPSDQAEAVRLRIFGGLETAEVGHVMGKSESAVKMLVLRATRNLQPRLAHWTEEER